MLDEIITYKREEVDKRKIIKPTLSDSLRYMPRDFLLALKQKSPAIIAEIKKASPSKGLICHDFNVKDIALSYQKAGAACLSVLTDEKFFKGKDSYLIEARKASSLPVLRKDFIIDSYQIYEANALGADAILLIAAVLDDKELKDYFDLANELSLTSLIECHSKEELDRALRLSPTLIGINNRNLKTFQTDLATTLDLITAIPPEVTIVSESGISESTHIKELQSHGVNAFLIGEALMKHTDPFSKLQELLNNHG